MADNDQEDGILRYLKEMDFKFFEQPLRNPMNRFNYDFEIIARDAMIQGAQRRFADASFPPELRLLVMKASVSYHVRTFEISLMTTARDLAQAAAPLFNPNPTSAAVHDTLQQTAEQALLETCIFKVERIFNPFDLHTTRGTAPLLETIGARIRHLEIHLDTSSCHQPYEKLVKASDSHKTLQRLQRLYPNLKSCLLTLELRTCFNPVANHTSPPFLTPPIADHKSPFPAGLLQYEFKQDQDIAHILAELLSVFAEKGPAVRRFVRLLHVQYHEAKRTAVYKYGPLVTAYDPKMNARSQGVAGGGAKMVSEAYRCARTAPEVKRVSRFLGHRDWIDAHKKRGSVRSVYWCPPVDGSKTHRLRRLIDQHGAGRAVQDEANAATMAL